MGGIYAVKFLFSKGKKVGVFTGYQWAIQVWLMSWGSQYDPFSHADAVEKAKSAIRHADGWPPRQPSGRGT
jgi:hypothetical protein